MCDICEALEPYKVEPPLIKKNLTLPPRELRKGERWDGENILYSAGWIDEAGEVREFEA